VAEYVSVSQRGSDLDVRARLFDSAGTLIASNNPPGDTLARIAADVPAGRYVLAVSGVGAGDPLDTGYSDYASIGQYFINGTLPNAAGKVLTGLAIAGPNAVDEDSSATYQATASWSDGSSAVVAAAWSETSPFATISNSGRLATAMVTGDQSVTVMASYSTGGVTQTASKTVLLRDIKKLLTGLSIGGPASLEEGGSAAYHATAAWDDGSSSAAAASWSENADFADIDADGVLTAGRFIGDRSVTVTASYSSGGIAFSVDKFVTVLDKTKDLVGLQVLGPDSLAENSSTAYSASAQWDDGSNSDVTAAWSEDSAHATIDSAGVLAAGKVTGDEAVTLQASFTQNGMTETAVRAVTILDMDKGLVGLTVSGPDRLHEKGAALYRATALWDDGSESEVAAEWSTASALAAVNSSGQLSVGQVTGTQSLRLRARFSRDDVTETATMDVTLTDRAASDFDGDGDGDVFWHHTEKSRNRLWVMENARASDVVGLPVLKNKRWQVAGIADFTGDGRSDVLWRNRKTGANRLWVMDGPNRLSDDRLPRFASSDWSVSGLGDFDGDGLADIFWHNDASGANRVWLMAAAARREQAALPAFSNDNWQPAAVGDFNGDGRADILWRNGKSGANRLWLMNGTLRAGNRALPDFAGTAWQAATVGDFDGDGRADILWRNTNSGANRMWLMRASAIKAEGALPPFANTAWSVAGSGDYDASGTVDLLWRNAATGANRVWLIDGLTRSGQASLAKLADSAWQVER
jgi:hypothetical protein